MKPDEQRIAIAEWMGWKFVAMAGEVGFYYFGPSNEDCILARLGKLKGATSAYELPDYPNDLNAMHEAEKKLIESNNAENMVYSKWLHTLQTVCCGTYDSFHASAQQRSEAICRTLWPERFKL